jgi:hypothetical protein
LYRYYFMGETIVKRFFKLKRILPALMLLALLISALAIAFPRNILRSHAASISATRSSGCSSVTTKPSSANVTCLSGSANAPVARNTPLMVTLPARMQACQSTSAKKSSSTAACSTTKPHAPKTEHAVTVSLPPGVVSCPSTTNKKSSPTVSCPLTAKQIAHSGAGYFISLSANSTMVAPAVWTALTATTNIDVGPTPYYIAIYDVTFAEFLGECATGTSCTTYVSEPVATTHYFIAYISDLTSSYPPSNIQATSNLTYVMWLTISVTLSANPQTLGVGGSSLLTASTNVDIGPTPYYIALFDQSTQTLLAWCGFGTTCTSSVSASSPNADTFIAYVSLQSTGYPPPTIQATSNQVSVTWISLVLSSPVSSLARGNTVTLTATASIDVGLTPYYIAIFDQTTRTIVGYCGSGVSCLAPTALSLAATHTFIAYISGSGTNYPPAHIFVTANTVAVTWFFWGVDSFSGVSSLYNSVNAAYGKPDFWGRYIGLGTYHDDLQPSEVTFAHTNSIAILPTYADFNQANVAGFATGQAYATTAITAAQQMLHIPNGVALFVDIEAGSKPDAAFITGWYSRFNSTFSYLYHGVTYTYQTGSYKAGYYGNTVATNSFTVAYCNAVSANAQIGTNAFIWTPQPSRRLTSRIAAPPFAPSQPSCQNNTLGWQYALSSGSVPNVDTDEVLGNFPLWHP